MSSRSGKPKSAGRRDAGLPGMVKSSETLANVFAALGDPTRLKLVAVLCAGGALSIAQLTANTDISLSARGSSSMPASVMRRYLRAMYPSSRSVEQAMMYMMSAGSILPK